MDILEWHPQNLNTNKPVYQAIADALEQDIRSGVVKIGQRLPPQRELADMVGVNVSTITRALNECRRRGLTTGTVGSGTYISADININVSMFEPTTFQSSLIELGLVYAIRSQDDELAKVIKAAMAAIDVKPFTRNVPPAGLEHHREIASRWLNSQGHHTGPGNILVSAGSQNGMACSLLALFRTGDYLAVDHLTYPGMKTLAAMLGIRLVPIAMDEKGMIPQELETACRRTAIRGVYLMPEMQNPTTVFLPDDRRVAIAQIAEKYDLTLIEDDADCFAGRLGHPRLCNLAPERTVYISGISKVLGAGLRISFLSVPERLYPLLEGAIMNAQWMASPINAEIVCHIITEGSIDGIVENKRREAKARASLALQKLAPYHIQSRENGYYLWLKLPHGWVTGREFELTAKSAGVNVLCGEKFAVGSEAIPATARIALTGPETCEELEKGLDILADILGGNNYQSNLFF